MSTYYYPLKKPVGSLLCDEGTMPSDVNFTFFDQAGIYMGKVTVDEESADAFLELFRDNDPVAQSYHAGEGRVGWHVFRPIESRIVIDEYGKILRTEFLKNRIKADTEA